jgi:hypothetical protein
MGDFIDRSPPDTASEGYVDYYSEDYFLQEELLHGAPYPETVTYPLTPPGMPLSVSVHYMGEQMPCFRSII